jgi:hypothetical protein
MGAAQPTAPAGPSGEGLQFLNVRARLSMSITPARTRSVAMRRLAGKDAGFGHTLDARAERFVEQDSNDVGAVEMPGFPSDLIDLPDYVVRQTHSDKAARPI